jgi:hypothetical protein
MDLKFDKSLHITIHIQERIINMLIIDIYNATFIEISRIVHELYRQPTYITKSKYM